MFKLKDEERLVVLWACRFYLKWHNKFYHTREMISTCDPRKRQHEKDILSNLIERLENYDERDHQTYEGTTISGGGGLRNARGLPAKRSEKGAAR